MRTAQLVGALLLFTLSAAAQNAPTAQPCTRPESKQFDFWVGEWDLTWPNPPGQAEGKGTNVIRKALDGCVIEENFDGKASNGLVGRSFSVFNVRTGKWHQTWVDNQGGYLDFTGGPQGTTFVFARDGKKPDGTPIKQRMVFKNITKDAFDWSWEASTDGGKTWTVNWPIHYTRTASPRPAR